MTTVPLPLSAFVIRTICPLTLLAEGSATVMLLVLVVTR
jgi:hypothetical protein